MIALAQVASSGTPADSPSPAPWTGRQVGVSVLASAAVLAPTKVVHDPQTGELEIVGQASRAQSNRDPDGTVWIEFS